MKKSFFILAAILFFSSFMAFEAEAAYTKKIRMYAVPQPNDGIGSYTYVYDWNGNVIAYISVDAYNNGETNVSVISVSGEIIPYTLNGGWFETEIYGAAKLVIWNEPVVPEDFAWVTSVPPTSSQMHYDGYIYSFSAEFDIRLVDEISIKFY